MQFFICNLYIFSIILFICVDSLPLSKFNRPNIPSIKALDFMKKFGYLEEDDATSSALYTEQGITSVIKLVQKYGALPQTGILDNSTLKLMSSPRCGVPDIIKNAKRQKRYAFGSQGWNKRRITYFIANWSPYLGEYTVMKNIQLALDTWGRYGHLTFHRVSNPNADIIVAFGSKDHGDRYPFDGPGIVLAHAFFPYQDYSLGGDIHFDNDENWVDLRNGEDKDGTDFFTVALHELGHSLGLAHSTIPTSVMFPYYKGFDQHTPIGLDYDDILGMYELYIKRNIEDKNYYPYEEETTTLTTISTTSTFSTSTFSYEGDDESIDDHKKHDPKHRIPSNNAPSMPNICDGHFDAVATLRNELFIFKGLYLWRLREKGRINHGYPIRFHQMFTQLPRSVKKIDAAYERPDGMIVLFSGRQYWVYNGKDFLENSPRPLSDYGLPEFLDHIDAVQNWGRNRKTYIYKGNVFWRYNENNKLMDSDYPKHIELWRGVPEYLDAATTWKDNLTYFFKGEWFWKFDNDWIMITEQSPLPAPQIWLGCEEDVQKMSKWYQ